MLRPSGIISQGGIVHYKSPAFILFKRRSDKEVLVDNFGCLTKVNMLTLLLLPFEVVCDLTFL